MKKYKGTYIFKFERDINDNIHNKDDNYIACTEGGKIYRYNEDTLVFESPKKIRLIKKNEDGTIKKDYSNLVLEVRDTDAEREIFFKEENISKLEDLFHIRKKRQLSEEDREKSRQRMLNLHKNKNAELDDIEEDKEQDETNELESDDVDK